MTRYALVHSGEAHALADDEVSEEGPAHTADEHLIIDTVPWIWPKLQPPMQPEGSVVVGLGHPDTAPALSRLGVLLAHNFAAGPTAVYVSTTKSSEDFWAGAHDDEALALFRLADAEAAKMGYSLLTEVAFADEVPDGIVKVANEEDAHLVVIGRTDTKHEEQFSRTVSTLAREAACPVVVAKFVGPLHTERMLVPVQDQDDYRIVQPIVEALAGVGEHTITLLHMMPPEAAPSELEEGQAEMMDWPGVADLPGQVICKAVSVEARVQEIADAAETTDIVIMPSRGRSGLRRLLFGSLSDDVAKATSTSMLVVVRATPPADAELEQYQSI